jgi:hypothetical protein
VPTYVVRLVLVPLLLFGGLACSRTVSVQLEPGTTVELEGRAPETAQAGGLRLSVPLESMVRVRLAMPGHSTVVTDLVTTIDPDKHDYGITLLYRSCWGCTIVNRWGSQIGYKTDIRAHTALFEHPLALLGPEGVPFSLPTSGQGVVVVLNQPGRLRVDGQSVQAMDAEAQASRAWSAPVVVSLPVGPHRVEAWSRSGEVLETSVSILPDEYVYLCAKVLWKPNRGGSGWLR